MAYHRVIPRDLFNEGDLLKCMGKLWIGLDQRGMADCLEQLTEGPFIIDQDPSSGSISVRSIRLTIRGETVYLSRPLNSREPYPLWAATEDGEQELRVLDQDGDLSLEFREWLLGQEG